MADRTNMVEVTVVKATKVWDQMLLLKRKTPSLDMAAIIRITIEKKKAMEDLLRAENTILRKDNRT